jgi:hypothetical protein
VKTYRITINRGRGTGILGPEDGTYIVSATHPSVALKRLLDGGHEANYRFATVGSSRLELARGQRVSILIERIS